MAKKSNSRSRLARPRLAIGRRAGPLAIKPRRLRVEAIEDRLLLSGTSFAITDISVLLRDDNSSGFIVLSTDAGIPKHYQENWHGTLLGTCDSFSVSNAATVDYSGWGNIGDLVLRGNSGSTAGGDLLRLVIGDLPNQSPQDGMIDVGTVPKQPLDAFQGPMLAQQKSDLLHVEIGKTSVPVSGSATPKMAVDGAHGTIQVFEIAAVAGKESAPSVASLPMESAKTAPLETTLNATRTSSQLAQHTSQELKLAETQSSSGPVYARSSLSTVEQDRFKVISLDSSQKAIAAAIPTNAAPVRQFDTAVSKASLASVTTLTKSAVPAEICRQVVFAEMTEKTVEKAELPISLGDYRTKNLAGVAIVAIVGQQLSKKWRHSSPPIDTHQIPPRRRSLSA